MVCPPLIVVLLHTQVHTPRQQHFIVSSSAFHWMAHIECKAVSSAWLFALFQYSPGSHLLYQYQAVTPSQPGGVRLWSMCSCMR